MRISDIQGDKAIDVLADMIDPMMVIFGDEEIKSIAQNENIASAVKYALKNYKKEVLTVLALLDGEDPETYAPKLTQIPGKIMEIMEDEDINMLFRSQGQNGTLGYSGSATVTTEETEEV